MDELAKMFGAKPNLLKYWFTDPRLAYILLFGGMAAYQFRLNVRFNFNKMSEKIPLINQKNCFDRSILINNNIYGNLCFEDTLIFIYRMYKSLFISNLIIFLK